MNAAHIRGALLSNGYWVILLLVFAGFSFAPNFATPSNLISLLHSSTPIFLMAIGLALVLMSGNIDISIGSVAYLSTGIAAVLMRRQDIPPEIAVPIVLLVGLACGVVNATLVVGVGINPLITSLGMLFAYRGIALLLTGARVTTIPEGLSNLSSIQLAGPIFADVIFAALVFLVFYLLHSKTRFGRYILAIGNNREVTRWMGINVKRVQFTAFVLSSLMASIGGLVLMLHVGGVSAYMGRGLEFQGIAVCVIGGISLTGGRGTIPGYLAGVLTLAVIENGLNHMGASAYIFRFVRGGIILVAMYLDAFRSRRLEEEAIRR
jgi:ribose/xylose/arabinose/galactoside ABC-type transport system permease subunit